MRETDYTVQMINPKKRNQFLANLHDYNIMHYEALRLMPELQKAKFGHAIYDECHRIKNKNSQQSKAAKKLRTPYLTDMSGSPMTDRPQDMWSILNHLHSKKYSSYWRFFYEYVDYIHHKKGTPCCGASMNHKASYYEILGVADAWEESGFPQIQPYFVRRLQKDCSDIPPKLYSKIYVDLAPTQRRIYNEMRTDMLTWIKNSYGDDEALPAPAIIAKLTRLQQIAAGTPEFGPPDKKGNPTITLKDPSSKADAVMDKLEDNEDHQFVIFSQFKGPLRILASRLERKKITFGTFTGDDDQRIRNRTKQKFIDGDARILLGTISAGGVGVDGLQHAASNVIFIDRDWSPAINDQAEDRLWRAGQKDRVNVIDIMAKDTIDFDKRRTVEMKAGWVRQMLGDK